MGVQHAAGLHSILTVYTDIYGRATWMLLHFSIRRDGRNTHNACYSYLVCASDMTVATPRSQMGYTLFLYTCHIIMHSLLIPFAMHTRAFTFLIQKKAQHQEQQRGRLRCPRGARRRGWRGQCGRTPGGGHTMRRIFRRQGPGESRGAQCVAECACEAQGMWTAGEAPG